MIKTFICEEELQREELCEKCKSSLVSQKLTDFDVKVSRVLMDISKKFFCTGLELKKIIPLENLIIVSCKGNIGGLIGKKGKVISVITKELGKKVRVIEHSKDEKKVIQDLVGKPKLLGVNKVFSKDGEILKPVFPLSDQYKFITKVVDIEKALKELLGKEVAIGFIPY